MAFFNKVADIPLSDFEGVVRKTTSREEVMAFINVSSQARQRVEEEKKLEAYIEEKLDKDAGLRDVYTRMLTVADTLASQNIDYRKEIYQCFAAA